MPYIKKIELKGFKSFGPQTVKVNLDRGFTAITGPNGSGKTNIMDALLFSLGELSTKRLRAENSAKLIFHGSEKAGMDKAKMAKVVVQFDNSDGLMPVDTTTVTISREVYRNGQSVYRLNGRRMSRQHVTETLSMAAISSMIGRSNIIIKTSNGYSPEMFPEYITDMQYFYGSAPRPGFNSRFIVSHDNIRAPYWPTSPNSFGGQIGASNNGDLPGDIYRLIGGVVIRNKGQSSMYAGYQANAFLLPKGTNNNRIVGPGTEDLQSPDGVPARFFIVPVRPGMVYSVGYTFGAVLQIDPVVNCSVRFSLTAPNGTTFTTTGMSDQYGYFAATDKWILDKAGVWAYTVNATWNGYQGKAPGLPAEGGWIYVIENGPPPIIGMTLKIPTIQTFSATTGLNISGTSTSSRIYFAAIIPGAILEEGTIPVTNNTFTYTFDPQHMANKIKTYDIVNLVSGKAEIGRVVHLTFFSEEQGPDGSTFHSFARVVLRGTTAVYIKER
jgi:energy-coupling factor transporter ATP-binding protein EcfA2